MLDELASDINSFDLPAHPDSILESYLPQSYSIDSPSTLNTISISVLEISIISIESNPSNHSISIHSYFSDGDGLVDGDISLNGCQCELVTSHNNVGQTMFTDPSMMTDHRLIPVVCIRSEPLRYHRLPTVVSSRMDTDGDGLSDGMEVAGWEVHIIKGSSKMEIRNWTVSSNPTIIDSDLDGVNDYQEFENQSDPNCNDTDGDYILDGNEEQGQLTQTDAEPPRIIKWDKDSMIHVEIIEHHDGLGGMVGTKEIKLSVKVYDPSGIAYVIFKLEGQTDQNRSGHNSINATVSATFKYDGLRGFTDGWDVKIIVYDRNHNGNSTTMHIDGFCEGVLKAICKFFEAVAKAVGELLSAVFDWIWDAIRYMLNGPIDSITALLKGWTIKLINAIEDSFNHYSTSTAGIGGRDTTPTGQSISNSDLNIFKNIIFGNIWWGFMALGIIMTAISILIIPFISAVAGLVASVSSFITPILVQAFAGSSHDKQKNPGLSASMTLDAFLSYLKPNYSKQTNDNLQFEPWMWSVITALIGSWFSYLSIFLPCTQNALVASVIGLGFAAFSSIFLFAGLFAEGQHASKDTVNMIYVISGVFGGLAAIISFCALLGASATVTIIITAISIVIGIIGVILSMPR